MQSLESLGKSDFVPYLLYVLFELMRKKKKSCFFTTSQIFTGYEMEYIAMSFWFGLNLQFRAGLS